jgi:hypothetical protein
VTALEAREAELKALDQEIAERESRLPPAASRAYRPRVVVARKPTRRW